MAPFGNTTAVGSAPDIPTAAAVDVVPKSTANDHISATPLAIGHD
jgi:hypothetical protein